MLDLKRIRIKTNEELVSLVSLEIRNLKETDAGNLSDDDFFLDEDFFLIALSCILK